MRNGRAIKDWEINQAKTSGPQWWSSAKREKKHQPKSNASVDVSSGHNSREPGTQLEALTPPQTQPPSLTNNVQNTQTQPPSLTSNSQATRPKGWDATPSNFIGQGRKIGYNGLTYAVLSSIEETPEDDPNRIIAITSRAKALFLQHTSRPPRSWWIIAVVSEMIVLIEIGMAVMMSSTVPTVGIGCRSGLYLLYALFSTLVWLLHLSAWFRRQGAGASFLGHVLCVLATLCLVFITFASVSRHTLTCTLTFPNLIRG